MYYHYQSFHLIAGSFVKEQLCGTSTAGESKFRISFVDEIDANYRKIMVGAVFLLDFVHFETWCGAMSLNVC